MSNDDRSRDKLEFYAGGGAIEMLFIDRNPWALELYRLVNGALELVGESTLSAHSQVLHSSVVPLSFRLISGVPRPQIEVTHNDGAQRWLV